MLVGKELLRVGVSKLRLGHRLLSAHLVPFVKLVLLLRQLGLALKCFRRLLLLLLHKKRAGLFRLHLELLEPDSVLVLLVGHNKRAALAPDAGLRDVVEEAIRIGHACK